MRTAYFDKTEGEAVSDDSIVADEAYIPEDEWEDMPTTPRFRHSTIGENNQD